MTCALSLTACGFFQTSAELEPVPDAARKVVKTAYSQMGKRYSAGNASPQKGFDCSGFVWWTYKVNGYKIPRISSEQARIGRPVSKDMVQLGDIVVFRTGQGPRSLHTGVYAGGNSFIHSPRKGGKVRLENMDIPYWRKKLIAIRRVVR
ncbi:MAG: C40 family peptidase [Desulfovibrio sp.]|nr:C40 family peptidase [Desulfovibrio sp.]